MDHEGTREELELAALEPGGLDRLMAGDTPTAQAVAAHLAGCPSCSDELVRLRRASTIIRSTVREMPPADLREWTLAAIRAEGVRRPLTATVPAAALASSAAPAPSTAPVAVDAGRAQRPSRNQWLGWFGTMAAVVVLSVVATNFVVDSRVGTEVAAQGVTIATLEAVTKATLDITSQPDAEHVDLAGTTDPTQSGDIVYSPSTTDLVVVAEGLAEPAPGQVYRCWVDVAGKRELVGRMAFSEKLAYWLGDVPLLSDLKDGAIFGISLQPASSTSIDADPVLTGEL